MTARKAPRHATASDGIQRPARGIQCGVGGMAWQAGRIGADERAIYLAYTRTLSERLSLFDSVHFRLMKTFRIDTGNSGIYSQHEAV